MTWIGCLDVTSWLTDALRDETVCAELRELRARHASPAELLNAISHSAGPDVAATALFEMGELPAYTIEMIVSAWEVAQAAGKPITIVSQRPASPLQFARDRRVGLSVEADKDEIRVGIQHVATRHAQWYQMAGTQA